MTEKTKLDGLSMKPRLYLKVQAAETTPLIAHWRSKAPVEVFGTLWVIDTMDGSTDTSAIIFSLSPWKQG